VARAKRINKEHMVGPVMVDECLVFPSIIIQDESLAFDFSALA